MGENHANLLKVAVNPSNSTKPSENSNVELVLEVELTESLAQLIQKDSDFVNKSSLLEVTVIEPPSTSKVPSTSSTKPTYDEQIENSVQKILPEQGKPRAENIPTLLEIKDNKINPQNLEISMKSALRETKRVRKKLNRCSRRIHSNFCSKSLPLASTEIQTQNDCGDQGIPSFPLNDANKSLIRMLVFGEVMKLMETENANRLGEISNVPYASLNLNTLHDEIPEKDAPFYPKTKSFPKISKNLHGRRFVPKPNIPDVQDRNKKPEVDESDEVLQQYWNTLNDQTSFDSSRPCFCDCCYQPESVNPSKKSQNIDRSCKIKFSDRSQPSTSSSLDVNVGMSDMNRVLETYHITKFNCLHKSDMTQDSPSEDFSEVKTTVESMDSKYCYPVNNPSLPRNYQNFCVFDQVCQRLNSLEAQVFKGYQDGAKEPTQNLVQVLQDAEVTNCIEKASEYSLPKNSVAKLKVAGKVRKIYKKRIDKPRIVLQVKDREGKVLDLPAHKIVELRNVIVGNILRSKSKEELGAFKDKQVGTSISDTLKVMYRNETESTVPIPLIQNPEVISPLIDTVIEAPPLQHPAADGFLSMEQPITTLNLTVEVGEQIEGSCKPSELEQSQKATDVEEPTLNVPVETKDVSVAANLQDDNISQRTLPSWVWNGEHITNETDLKKKIDEIISARVQELEKEILQLKGKEFNREFQKSVSKDTKSFDVLYEIEKAKAQHECDKIKYIQKQSSIRSDMFAPWLHTKIHSMGANIPNFQSFFASLDENTLRRAKNDISKEDEMFRRKMVPITMQLMDDLNKSQDTVLDTQEIYGPPSKFGPNDNVASNSESPGAFVPATILSKFDSQRRQIIANELKEKRREGLIAGNKDRLPLIPDKLSLGIISKRSERDREIKRDIDSVKDKQDSNEHQIMGSNSLEIRRDELITEITNQDLPLIYPEEINLGIINIFAKSSKSVIVGKEVNENLQETKNDGNSAVKDPNDPENKVGDKITDSVTCSVPSFHRTFISHSFASLNRSFSEKLPPTRLSHLNIQNNLLERPVNGITKVEESTSEPKEPNISVNTCETKSHTLTEPEIKCPTILYNSPSTHLKSPTEAMEVKNSRQKRLNSRIPVISKRTKIPHIEKQELHYLESNSFSQEKGGPEVIQTVQSAKNTEYPTQEKLHPEVTKTIDSSKSPGRNKIDKLIKAPFRLNNKESTKNKINKEKLNNNKNLNKNITLTKARTKVVPKTGNANPIIQSCPPARSSGKKKSDRHKTIAAQKSLKPTRRPNQMDSFFAQEKSDVSVVFEKARNSGVKELSSGTQNNSSVSKNTAGSVNKEMNKIEGKKSEKVALSKDVSRGITHQDKSRINNLYDLLLNADGPDHYQLLQDIYSKIRQKAEEFQMTNPNSDQSQEEKITLYQTKSVSSKMSTDSSDEFCEIEMTLSELEGLIEQKATIDRRRSYVITNLASSTSSITL